MPEILTPPSSPTKPPRRDPLDVPAERLRERIRLALSVLSHRADYQTGALKSADVEMVEHILIGGQWS